MARRDVAMREITEIIYQWHQGRSLRGLARSLGAERVWTDHTGPATPLATDKSQA